MDDFMKIKKILIYLAAMLVCTSLISANEKLIWDIYRKEPLIRSCMGLSSIAYGYTYSKTPNFKPSIGIAINFISNAFLGATILNNYQHNYSSKDIPFLLSESLAQVGLFSLGYLIHFIKNPIESAINNNFSGLLRYFYGPKLKISNDEILSILELDRNTILEHLLETKDLNTIDKILNICILLGNKSKKCLYTIMPLTRNNHSFPISSSELNSLLNLKTQLKNALVNKTFNEVVEENKKASDFDSKKLTSALQWALMEAIQEDNFENIAAIKPHVILPKYLVNYIKKYTLHTTLAKLRTALFNENNQKKFWISVIFLRVQENTEYDTIDDIIMHVAESYGTKCMLFREAIKSAKQLPNNKSKTEYLNTKFANLRASHEQVIKENPSDNYQIDPIVDNIYSYIGNNYFIKNGLRLKNNQLGNYSKSIQKREFNKS